MCLFMYVNIVLCVYVWSRGGLIVLCVYVWSRGGLIVLCVYVWSRGGLIVCLVIVNVNNITSVDIRMLIYKNEAITCVWFTVTFISRWSHKFNCNKYTICICK